MSPRLGPRLAIHPEDQRHQHHQNEARRPQTQPNSTTPPSPNHALVPLNPSPDPRRHLHASHAIPPTPPPSATIPKTRESTPASAAIPAAREATPAPGNDTPSTRSHQTLYPHDPTRPATFFSGSRGLMQYDAVGRYWVVSEDFVGNGVRGGQFLPRHTNLMNAVVARRIERRRRKREAAGGDGAVDEEGESGGGPVEDWEEETQVSLEDILGGATMNMGLEDSDSGSTKRRRIEALLAKEESGDGSSDEHGNPVAQDEVSEGEPQSKKRKSC